MAINHVDIQAEGVRPGVEDSCWISVLLVRKPKHVLGMVIKHVIQLWQ